MFLDDFVTSIIDGVITLLLQALPSELGVIFELIDAFVVFFQS